MGYMNAFGFWAVWARDLESLGFPVLALGFLTAAFKSPGSVSATTEQLVGT